VDRGVPTPEWYYTSCIIIHREIIIASTACSCCTTRKKNHVYYIIRTVMIFDSNKNNNNNDNNRRSKNTKISYHNGTLTTISEANYILLLWFRCKDRTRLERHANAAAAVTTHTRPCGSFVRPLQIDIVRCYYYYIHNIRGTEKTSSYILYLHDIHANI